MDTFYKEILSIYMIVVIIIGIILIYEYAKEFYNDYIKNQNPGHKYLKK